MSRDRADDRDDLATLLSDLRATLDELDRTLDADTDRDRGRDRRERRRSRSPEPPRGRDVVRFTEEYTIPTVISILETTIQSLELLRGVLRLVDPDRGFRGDRDGSRFDGVDRRVVDGAERAVEDLRRALSGTEDPSDPVARDVLGDARSLTAEIESLLSEAREGADASRSRGRRRTSGERDGRGVSIPVDDADADGRDSDDYRQNDGVDDAHTDDDANAGVEIDVDAELESIRNEVRGESGSTGGAGENERDDDERSDAEGEAGENGDGTETDGRDERGDGAENEN
ncbi:DUF7547 family protein [Salinigranum sp. GCM10025319]|uniref:DUF7547 family protein n=1 Tax=Salinigranum sp. GCM10025319 TaxID=3252687 RepID=UPI003606EB0F